MLSSSPSAAPATILNNATRTVPAFITADPARYAKACTIERSTVFRSNLGSYLILTEQSSEYKDEPEKLTLQECKTRCEQDLRFCDAYTYWLLPDQHPLEDPSGAEITVGTETIPDKLNHRRECRLFSKLVQDSGTPGGSSSSALATLSPIPLTERAGERSPVIYRRNARRFTSGSCAVVDKNRILETIAGGIHQSSPSDFSFPTNVQVKLLRWTPFLHTDYYLRADGDLEAVHEVADKNSIVPSRRRTSTTPSTKRCSMEEMTDFYPYGEEDLSSPQAVFGVDVELAPEVLLARLQDENDNTLAFPREEDARVRKELARSVFRNMEVDAEAKGTHFVFKDRNKHARGCRIICELVRKCSTYVHNFQGPRPICVLKPISAVAKPHWFPPSKNAGTSDPWETANPSLEQIDVYHTYGTHADLDYTTKDLHKKICFEKLEPCCDDSCTDNSPGGHPPNALGAIAAAGAVPASLSPAEVVRSLGGVDMDVIMENVVDGFQASNPDKTDRSGAWFENPVPWDEIRNVDDRHSEEDEEPDAHRVELSEWRRTYPGVDDQELQKIFVALDGQDGISDGFLSKEEYQVLLDWAGKAKKEATAASNSSETSTSKLCTWVGSGSSCDWGVGDSRMSGRCVTEDALSFFDSEEMYQAEFESFQKLNRHLFRPKPVEVELQKQERHEQCSAKCKPGGVVKQRRRITVEPKNGGKACPTDLEREVSCNANRPCDTDKTRGPGESSETNTTEDSTPVADQLKSVKEHPTAPLPPAAGHGLYRHPAVFGDSKGFVALGEAVVEKLRSQGSDFAEKHFSEELFGKDPVVQVEIFSAGANPDYNAASSSFLSEEEANENEEASATRDEEGKKKSKSTSKHSGRGKKNNVKASTFAQKNRQIPAPPARKNVEVLNFLTFDMFENLDSDVHGEDEGQIEHSASSFLEKGDTSKLKADRLPLQPKFDIQLVLPEGMSCKVMKKMEDTRTPAQAFSFVEKSPREQVFDSNEDDVLGSDEEQTETTAMVAAGHDRSSTLLHVESDIMTGPNFFNDDHFSRGEEPQPHEDEKPFVRKSPLFRTSAATELQNAGLNRSQSLLRRRGRGLGASTQRAQTRDTKNVGDFLQQGRNAVGKNFLQRGRRKKQNAEQDGAFAVTLSP
ncbi:unnamed protein product [Amoebophrya sp. A120]|nr:unnamed protein product [Amoebophrya sp. A120]|eukprot:GSA120T00021244001.1